MHNFARRQFRSTALQAPRVKLAATTALSLLACGSCAAFAPNSQSSKHVATSLNATELNGWVPDEPKFAFGLPGSVNPIPNFDPLGFAERADLVQMKQCRESEAIHGRVAMLAALGFLIAESPIELHLPSLRLLARVSGPLLFATSMRCALQLHSSLRFWQSVLVQLSFTVH